MMKYADKNIVNYGVENEKTQEIAFQFNRKKIGMEGGLGVKKKKITDFLRTDLQVLKARDALRKKGERKVKGNGTNGSHSTVFSNR